MKFLKKTYNDTFNKVMIFIKHCSDEESRVKLKVEIKPIRTNGAATPSFDELSTVIGKLELAPPPTAVRTLQF